MSRRTIRIGSLVLYADTTPGVKHPPAVPLRPPSAALPSSAAAAEAMHDSPQPQGGRPVSTPSDVASASAVDGPASSDTPQLFRPRPALPGAAHHNAQGQQQRHRFKSRSPSPGLLSSLPSKGPPSSASSSDFSFGAASHCPAPRHTHALATPGTSRAAGGSRLATSAAPSPMAISPFPGDTPSYLDVSATLPHPAADPSTSGRPADGPSDGATSAAVLPLVSAHLSLQLLEARPLSPASRAWLGTWERITLDDIDLTTRAAEEAEEEEEGAAAAPALAKEEDCAADHGASSASGIWAALHSMSGTQRGSVKRLLCGPELLAADASCFEVLSDCPNLAFLILSMPPALQQQQQQQQRWQQSVPSVPLPSCEAGSAAAAAAPMPVAATQTGSSAQQQQQAEDDEQRGADQWHGLGRLLECLPALVCLDMSACQVQDSTLQAIADSGRAGCLRALDLSYTPAISAPALVSLLAACPSLEELDISACPAATGDAVLDALALFCPRLSSLYLGSDGEDDAAGGADGSPAQAMASPGAALTAAGLGRLVATLPSLDYLQVLGWSQADMAALAVLELRHPQLRLVTALPGSEPASPPCGPESAPPTLQDVPPSSASRPDSGCGALRDVSNKRVLQVAGTSATKPGSSGKKAWKRLMSFLSTDTGNLALQ